MRPPREVHGVFWVVVFAVALAGAVVFFYAPRPEPRLLTAAEIESIAEQCEESTLLWQEVEASLACAEMRIYEIPRTCRCADAEAYAIDSTLPALPRCPEVAEWEGDR